MKRKQRRASKPTLSKLSRLSVRTLRRILSNVRGHTRRRLNASVGTNAARKWYGKTFSLRAAGKIEDACAMAIARRTAREKPR